MNIVEVVNSIKQSQRSLRDLEKRAILLWGDLYWLDSGFQSSVEAVIMEKVSTDIHYELQKFNSFTSLN